MKVSKKWILATLVILGIGSLWLSKNAWIFEKKISNVDYVATLEDSEWTNKERKINFFSNGIFESLKYEYPEYKKSGTWQINKDIIFIKSSITIEGHTETWNEEWQIDILTNKSLTYKVLGPTNQKIKLIRLENQL